MTMTLYRVTKYVKIHIYRVRSCTMVSKSSLQDIEKRLVSVLKHLQQTESQFKLKLFTECDKKMPSSAANFMGPDVRLDRNSGLISDFFL